MSTTTGMSTGVGAAGPDEPHYPRPNNHDNVNANANANDQMEQMNRTQHEHSTYEDRSQAGQDSARVIELHKPATDQHRDGRRDEASDSHYDVPLDEEPTPGGDPVDIAAAPAGAQPIIPASLDGWANIKASLRYAAKVTGYRVAFHAVRSPWYGAQALLWSLVGVFRLVGRLLRWWWLAEQTGLRQTAADAGDPQTWYKLHREVKATRAWRFLVLAAASLSTRADVS